MFKEQVKRALKELGRLHQLSQELAEVNKRVHTEENFIAGLELLKQLGETADNLLRLDACTNFLELWNELRKN